MDAVPDPGGARVLLAGRYDVGALVGLGGTAQVYRAWDHEDGCPVAVKIFRPGSALGPGCGGAGELAVLTGVRHPGLVGVRDAGVDPQGCPFVVMDLVDGQTLSARLHDGPFPAAAAVRLGTVLADALAVVHARGVVHRDVKPGNVLLDHDEHPWLTDFGIARVVDATRVTATGVVVGTAAYMAPEQVRGEAVGPPADVYALGLVLLEAVTGRREYGGGALESALARLHRAPLVPATLPDPLGATLRRMTAADPGERPTASAVAAALGRRVAAGPPRRAGGVAGIARRRAAPVAALACLVAAALAGALSLAPDRVAEEPRGVVVPAAAPPVAPPPVPPQVPPAEAPAPQPVAVALANPDRPLPPRARTVPRATVDRSDAPRKDRRGDDADGSRADESRAGDEKDADDKSDDESDADERSDDDRDDRGTGRDDDDKGGKGKSGKADRDKDDRDADDG